MCKEGDNELMFGLELLVRLDGQGFMVLFGHCDCVLDYLLHSIIIATVAYLRSLFYVPVL